MKTGTILKKNVPGKKEHSLTSKVLEKWNLPEKGMFLETGPSLKKWNVPGKKELPNNGMVPGKKGMFQKKGTVLTFRPYYSYFLASSSLFKILSKDIQTQNSSLFKTLTYAVIF